jgi:diguanylate cyclase (GGDEF)-like protein
VAQSSKRYNLLAKRLSHEASHDALSKLPNRRYFEGALKALIARNSRLQAPFALLLIDLDGFKKVNDTYGHAVGDEVLQEVAQRFKTSVGENGFLARLGGDEFGLLVDGGPSNIDLARLGRRLIEATAPALHPSLPSGAVGASIGVALYPRNGVDGDALTRAADVALYDAKTSGRGMVSFASRHGD